MKKFLLLIREDIARLQQMSDVEIEEDIAEMNSWVEKLTQQDLFVAGEPLENESKLVGQVATDGPFIEAKEGISGYVIVMAADLEQAAQLASQCPHVRQQKISIEVRQILNLENFNN